MFGYTLIKKDRLKELESMASRFQTFSSYHYWFSGFPPIYELLNKFVRHDIHGGNIWEIRSQFGKIQGLDSWGQPLKKPRTRKK